MSLYSLPPKKRFLFQGKLKNNILADLQFLSRIYPFGIKVEKLVEVYYERAKVTNALKIGYSPAKIDTIRILGPRGLRALILNKVRRFVIIKNVLDDGILVFPQGDAKNPKIIEKTSNLSAFLRAIWHILKGLMNSAEIEGILDIKEIPDLLEDLLGARFDPADWADDELTFYRRQIQRRPSRTRVAAFLEPKYSNSAEYVLLSNEHEESNAFNYWGKPCFQGNFEDRLEDRRKRVVANWAQLKHTSEEICEDRVVRYNEFVSFS